MHKNLVVTHTTTVTAVMGWAEGKTIKKTKSKDESQSKKKTQSTKGKQQKDESQNQTEKQSQTKRNKLNYPSLKRSSYSYSQLCN